MLESCYVFIFSLNFPSKGHHLSSQSLCHLYTLAVSHTVLGDVVPRSPVQDNEERLLEDETETCSQCCQVGDSPQGNINRWEGTDPRPKQFLPHCWAWCLSTGQAHILVMVLIQSLDKLRMLLQEALPGWSAVGSI